VTESELLDKIKADPAQFAGVFKLYYVPIFGYILRRTGDFDATADIAADTFLKAFLHIGNFNYTGIPVKVWLYRIATNEVNMFFRNRRRHNSIFEKFDVADKEEFKSYMEQDREAMESELQQHEQFVKVLGALKTLPEKHQEVIALRYFEGKNNREIAEILNLNEGTLKSLLSRGLEKLREKCNQF
jgi:RNA polymerase sigma-70 factor (ECF subfamily)